jgi:hypothetical protein
MVTAVMRDGFDKAHMEKGTRRSLASAECARRSRDDVDHLTWPSCSKCSHGFFETLCGYRTTKTGISVAPSAATNLWTTLRAFLINLTTSKASNPNVSANLFVADDDSAPKMRRKRQPLPEFLLHRATAHLQNAIQAFYVIISIRGHDVIRTSTQRLLSSCGRPAARRRIRPAFLF